MEILTQTNCKRTKRELGAWTPTGHLIIVKELFFISVGNNGIEVTFVGSFRDAHWDIYGRIGMMYGICFRITS